MPEVTYGGGGTGGVPNLSGAAFSAFGTLETAELTPLVQLDFIYGINIQTGVTAASGVAAAVDTNSSRLRLQSGTGAAGSAVFSSRKPARYRPGQGCVARFTAVFDTAVANNTQIVGVGGATDGYFFGYNGTAFGILHRIRTVNTWIAQTSWNGDKCNGTTSPFTWNPLFGNVMMIKYPYLGYGTIRFYVQNPVDGTWILCHTIQYPNTVATTQASNPALTFYAQQLNSGNLVNKTLYVGSVGIFLSGQRLFVGSPKWGVDNNKAAVTTEVNILTLQNATTYNGVANAELIRLNHVSFGSDGATGVSTLRLKLNATLGGTPSYTPVNGATADNGVTITSGNSVTSFDVAGTTVTGGLTLFNLTGQNPNSQDVDLTPLDLFIGPAEILTLSVFSTTSGRATVAVNFTEDI